MSTSPVISLVSLRSPTLARYPYLATSPLHIDPLSSASFRALPRTRSISYNVLARFPTALPTTDSPFVSVPQDVFTRQDLYVQHRHVFTFHDIRPTAPSAYEARTRFAFPYSPLLHTGGKGWCSRQEHCKYIAGTWTKNPPHTGLGHHKFIQNVPSVRNSLVSCPIFF